MCWQILHTKVWYLHVWSSRSFCFLKWLMHSLQLKVGIVFPAASRVCLCALFLSLSSLASLICSNFSSSSVIGLPCFTVWWAVSCRAEGKASLHLLYSKVWLLFLCCKRSSGILKISGTPIAWMSPGIVDVTPVDCQFWNNTKFPGTLITFIAIFWMDSCVGH